MVFCGKCGFRLTSGNILCPRCGTPTETHLIAEESQPDSPTIASSTNLGINQAYSSTQGIISPSRPVEQQPIVLDSHPNDYATEEQMANEATSMIGSQSSAAGQVPHGTIYPGYNAQNAVDFAQQRTSYHGSSMQGDTPYQQYGTSGEDAEKVRARGRIVGLLLILLGLLFILGAMVLFILTHNTSTSASSSIQHAYVGIALIYHSHSL